LDGLASEVETVRFLLPLLGVEEEASKDSPKKEDDNEGHCRPAHAA
jgi:hypothetical protein